MAPTERETIQSFTTNLIEKDVIKGARFVRNFGLAERASVAADFRSKWRRCLERTVWGNDVKPIGFLFVLAFELDGRQHLVPGVLAGRIAEHLDVVDTSRRAWSRVRQTLRRMRFRLSRLKKLSATALSWQLPRRLIKGCRPWYFRNEALHAGELGSPGPNAPAHGPSAWVARQRPATPEARLWSSSGPARTSRR